MKRGIKGEERKGREKGRRRKEKEGMGEKSGKVRGGEKFQ